MRKDNFTGSTNISNKEQLSPVSGSNIFWDN